MAWFKNYLNEDIVSLFFSRNDLVITPACHIDEDVEEADTYTKYEYRTTAACAKERLDVQGFGINNLERLFNEHVVQAMMNNHVHPMAQSMPFEFVLQFKSIGYR